MKTIPRQEIVTTLIEPIIGDAAIVRNSQIFVPGAEGYDESVAVNGSDAYAEVDIAGAQALLAQAGVTEPRSASCTRRTTRAVSTSSRSSRRRPPGRLQRHRLRREEWGGLLGTPGAYDASLFGWQSTSLGVTNSLPTFETGGINNLNYYSNPQVDDSSRS